MKFSAFITFVIVSIISFSQNSLKNYHYGSYTTKEGQVVNGYIKNLGLGNMSKEIKYKKGDSSGPKWLTWYEIKSYRFNGFKYVSIGQKGCFMQQVKTGQLTLYRKYSVDDIGLETYRYYMALNGEKMLKVKEGNFRKKVSEYVSDYPELQNRILCKELRYKNIQSVVNQYNKWYSE